MPSRIIRESILTSKSLSRISAEAERLFYRLIAAADDAGRFHADPQIVLGRCMPLLMDRVTSQQVDGWLGELEAEDIIRRYEVDGHRYLLFTKWPKYQRLRNTKPKYPDPPADILPQVAGCSAPAESTLPQLAATCGNPPQISADGGESLQSAARACAPAHARASESETETESIEEIRLDSIPPYGRDTVSTATTGSAAPDGASSPRRGPDPSHIQDPDSVDDPLDKLVLTAKKRWPPPAERNVPETLKWRKTLDAMLKVDRIKPEVVAKLIEVCPLESPDPWDFRRWARDQPATEMRRRHKLPSAKEVKHLV